MASLSAVSKVLAHRNMRIFYGGSLTAWTGLWVQKVAVDWLAWQLTHSPLWVGVLAFCNLAPSVIVSPFAGAVADRMDRVRLTMVTQYITVAHALTLAALTYTGLVRVEYIACLEVLLGSAQAFAQPARQSLVPGMVTRSELPGAVALNSLTYNLARSIGPGIGGVIVALFGVVPPMLVNAAAYLYASTTLPRLDIDPAHRRGHAPTGSVLREVVEGITYVTRHPGMGPLFLFATLIGVLVRPVPEMLPPFIDTLFHQDARGLATVSSVMGVAAMVGGIVVAVRGRLTAGARHQRRHSPGRGGLRFGPVRLGPGAAPDRMCRCPPRRRSRRRSPLFSFPVVLRWHAEDMRINTFQIGPCFVYSPLWCR